MSPLAADATSSSNVYIVLTLSDDPSAVSGSKETSSVTVMVFGM